MILRRYIFLSSLAVGALLVLAAPSVAQHSQPAKVGLYLTQVIRSDQPISRNRVLYLPPEAAAAITTKPTQPGGNGGNGGGKSGGGKSGGSSTTCPTTSTSTYSVGCPVAPTTSVPEAEEEIAADPVYSGGPTYVAAISDFSLRGGYNTTKWAISIDGGSTWSQHFVPLDSQDDPTTSNDMNMVWGANSDPDVAIDRVHNVVYLSDLYLGASPLAQGFLPNGLYVSSGTIGNLSSGNQSNFANTEPVMVNIPSNNTAACDPNGPNVLGYTGFCLEDKPWIAVDNSTTDNTQGVVYVVWDHFWSCYDLGFGSIACNGGPDIYLSYSTDAGVTWSAPITIDTGTIPTGQSQSGDVEGPQVAVGPNGTVYIAYEAFDPGSNTRWQYLTWSSEPAVSGTGSSETLSFNFSTPTPATPGFQDLSFTSNYRVNSFPALAIGGSGKVDLEYADQVSNNSEIEFVTCTPTTTANCTTPLAINGQHSKGQEFFPAISVDSSGIVNTSWFDTRNSSHNTADFDVYAAFDSGSGFSSAARVTPATINTGAATFIGDYSGIAAVSGASPGLSEAHPVWNDFSETCGLVTCQLSGTMQTATLTTP